MSPRSLTDAAPPQTKPRRKLTPAQRELVKHATREWLAARRKAVASKP